MSNDTRYQRAKILVEETRRFYFQIIFTIGMFIVVILRTLFINRPFLEMDSISFMGENVSSTPPPELTFMNSPLFILSYVGVIFLLFIGFRYLKLYMLKRSFKNEESAVKRLKKYMKTDEIPKNEDIDAKFNEDKNKDKKRFYILVIRVIALNILLYYIYSTFFSYMPFFELIIAFSILTLSYRYLIVFHADKKLLDKNWENKKIEEYIQLYSEI